MARGFAHSPEASVQVLDAARAGLHRSQVALLAQSHHRAVRETIAARDDVPLGVQAALSQDDAVEVRAATAANVHTMRAVLECLSADRSKTVLAALLHNPCVSFEIVDRLSFHRRADVRQFAAARLNDALPLPPADAVSEEEDAKFPELRERAAPPLDVHALAAS